ncbi:MULTISPECIES: Na+/H+ antiporter NhaC family protein [unclassified Sedimentibacter]|uniref:Na+/H+ antiporter NhaC family protein n=1 Tax=unclassified Sedimentibacter TaxID=2649220 RepID=UPI0027E103EE|nr:Na+/H+ antiporter NhaC family protein [Sedimentibacter sp. MB35-C1]WMJ76055.1 Na+/H+ antiporter NhaC family protein [Sedimentibacter sp. MB35-C1]
MEEVVNMGIISIVPSLLAIVLSFATRNTVVSLAFACIVGVLLAGQGLMGFPTLLKTSLGTTSFSWVMLLNTFIAILVAFFRKTGAIQGFSQYIQNKNLSRKSIQLVAWILGVFVYFSDSFSPLFVGTTMRNISDKAKISREKLSYIADSGAAPVSVLVPITGWAAYLSGLAIGIGAIATQEDAMELFIGAMPFNFYALITIAFVGLISSGIIKDFGPMKKAEERAINEGKVLRDGANPLIGRELTEMEPYEGIKERVFLNFILPVVMIMAIAIGTYIKLKSAKTMEAFLFVMIFMGISMFIQGVPFNVIMGTVTDGIKGAVPAIIILALAYSINALSKTMGTANYIISVSEGFLSPQLLPCIIFLIASIMAFATGSSWGTFAICMPIALPLAFNFTGGEVTVLVMSCFAAVAGGGVFGDHCSPLSDTTILASTGAAADHIDHVKTQLPYALICGSIAIIAYLIIGFTSI